MKPREAGVTLMELLLAVTLVALLSVGMLFAIRVGLKAMERSNARLLSNRRVSSVERILEQQIAGLMPVTALCGAAGGQGGRNSIFFQGETGALRFVSSFSLQEGNRGMPMMLEYVVIPGDEGRGVRLVLNESVYSGPIAAGALCSAGADGAVFSPVQAGPGSFVLADKLAYCRLSYHDVPQPTQTEAPGWLAKWPRPYLLPSAIRVDMAPLDPDGSRLEPLPLTIPIHVNRLPLERYDF